MANVMWANEGLFDRLIVSADGQHVGMVDDLELSDAKQPEVTAFLCGPTALGPRLGDHLGIWWLSVGRRLRPTGDPYPNRVPIADMKTIEHEGITLRVKADELPSRGSFNWALQKVVARIPGNGS